MTDGSPGMIDKLMAKGLYKNAWVVRLGGSSDRIHPEIPDNSYDVAVIMGGFAQSHLPPDCLYQVARSIKKGKKRVKTLESNVWIRIFRRPFY